MPFDSDVALLGTGVAPLVAAHRLLAEGKSVLLLNPDWDFFREDSELSLDPLWPAGPATLTPKRLMRSSLDRALEELRPEFPGPIEIWPKPQAKDSGTGSSRYHDPFAPHVRSRSRLWIQPADPRWEAFEDMYVETSDAGLNPQLLEGLIAVKRFPGTSGRAEGEEFKGVLIPRLIDVDVARYRNGLLEFVRERLGHEGLICNASQVELIPEGVRFHAGGAARTARLRDGLLVFWTPRLTQWVLAQAKKREVTPRVPKGVRLWEEWSLVSREGLDPSIVGVYEDMAVWADLEGAPGSELERVPLSVLRAGRLVGLTGQWATDWAGAESFAALSRLCYGFLRWDRFSVRAMRPRATLEWEHGAAAEPWSLNGPGPAGPPAWVVPGSDGPLVEVVRTARLASRKLDVPVAAAKPVASAAVEGQGGTS